MRPVNARKVRIKCSVRGCPNVKEVFAFSRSAEAGNTPVICLSCAKEIGALAEKLLKEQEAPKVEEAVAAVPKEEDPAAGAKEAPKKAAKKKKGE